MFPTKRTWKRVAIGLVMLLAIALIANGIMAWRTEAQWRARTARIRSAGDPASISDLAPTPIPEAENAAAKIAKLGPRLKEFGRDIAHFTNKEPLGIDYEKRGESGEPATAEQIVAIRKVLDKYSDIDAGLAAAAACDKYASVANYSLGHAKLLEEFLLQMQGIRTAARFLDRRIEVLVVDQQQDKAVETGIEMLRLARGYDHEPLLVNMLVTTAVRSIAVTSLYDALAAGRVSPEVHVALDHELAINDDQQRMVRTLKTERAYASDAALAIPFSGARPPRLIVYLFGWTLKRSFVGALDFLDDSIALTAQRSQSEPQGVGHHQIPESSRHGIMAELMIPAQQSAFAADARSTAMVRALRIFNALRLFEETNGREAKGLDELGMPNEATIDPFDGKPLKIKYTDKGWVVYTVMLNGIDDGGDFMQLKDYGVAPRGLRLTENPESPANDSEPMADP